MMDIVIKIDDKLYDLIKHYERSIEIIEEENDTLEIALMRAIIKGTPLPEHYGRLIDADSTLATAWTNFYKHEDELEKKDNDYLPFGRMYDQNGFECCQQTIVNAPIIIEGE